MELSEIESSITMHTVLQRSALFVTLITYKDTGWPQLLGYSTEVPTRGTVSVRSIELIVLAYIVWMRDCGT